MAAVRPGEALHANRSTTTAGGTRLRTALVVAQFALAIGMLIALLVAQQQYRHLQAAERHIDTDHVVTLWGLRWPEVRDGAQAFMREVRVLPGVLAVSSSERIPTVFNPDPVSARLADRPDAATTVIDMASIDDTFFDLYRVPLLAGRRLGQEHELGAGHGLTFEQTARRGINVVIDAAAARNLGLAQPMRWAGPCSWRSASPRARCPRPSSVWWRPLATVASPPRKEQSSSTRTAASTSGSRFAPDPTNCAR
jgi:putative ABC transport system permease protein